MSHQDLVLQALGMDNYDNAVDLHEHLLEIKARIQWIPSECEK